MSLPPLFSALDHVGLAVADLDEAIALHTRSWGLRLTHREDNGEQGVAEAMLAAADGGPEIQLLAPLAADSPVARFLDRRGPGLHHLAYRVSDVIAAAAQLREGGLRVLYDAPRRGTRNSLINFVHPAGVDGVLTEIVQHTTGASAPKTTVDPAREDQQ